MCVCDMERDLSDRDRVGLTDQVLLENYTSEEAFIDNLEKRFNNDLIYVSLDSCRPSSEKTKTTTPDSN